MLPKIELTEPVLLGSWDGRSDFVCQCPEKREKQNRKKLKEK